MKSVTLTVVLVVVSLASLAFASPPPPPPSVLGLQRPSDRGASAGDGGNLGNLYAAPAARPVTLTVTQITTVDRSVVITDVAYNSVPVTITNLNVWTSTLPTQLVLQTPVDNDVAIRTQVVERPTTLTVTDGTSNFAIVTQTDIQHYTITHNYYKIMQSTYTRTATNTITFSSTLVRTNIRTETSLKTEYRTIYNTIFVERPSYH